MHTFNRLLIVVFAALLAIALLVLTIIVWADPEAGVERLADLTSYLEERTDDNLVRALISLAAITGALLALMLLIVEASPEGRDRIRLRSGKDGSIELSTASINRRLEADLRQIAAVREARVEARGLGKGVGVRMDLAVDPDANLLATSDDACRIVKETIEQRVGVSLIGAPTVYLRYIDSTEPSTPTSPLAPPAGPTASTASAPPGPQTPETPGSPPPADKTEQ